MRLHEIIAANEVLTSSIEIQQIVKYKKSLLTIYGSESILMVTAVFNACQYARIVDACEFIETVTDYVATIPDLSDEDRENEIELINFQSIQLKNL